MKIILGGHWSNNPGWEIFTQEQQDITKPLQFDDNSIDCIFTEHVIEHINFIEAIDFFKEALRVLKPGGILRTVCPFLDIMINAYEAKALEKSVGQIYVATSLERACQEEIAVMNKLGLDGIRKYPDAFQFVAMYMRYQHKFVWNTALMKEVLITIGYQSARKYQPGEGCCQENCIERKRRGLYHGNDYKKDREPCFIYDIEGCAVEAIK